MPKTHLDDIEIHWEIQRLYDEIRRLQQEVERLEGNIALASFILKDFYTDIEYAQIVRALREGVGP